MAATKLNANWTGVAHGSTSITRVTTVMFNQGGSLQEFAGDNDKYPTVIVNLMNKPTASVTSNDPAVLMGIDPGTTASLTATSKDAKLASGGDIAYTLANAVAENAQHTGGFGNFQSATQTYRAYSSDGSTSPLSFTRV